MTDNLSRNKSRLASGLALASGFAALIHELLWTRRLTDLLGASTESTSRVFGFFFLGLALGSAAAAWRINRVERPWRVVALAEAGVAVFAMPMLFLPEWSAWVWPTLGLERLVTWPGAATKTVISGMAILPPAICMGLVLPFLTNGLLRWTRNLQTDGVRLYAINTLGGAIGLFVAVIWLLPALGSLGSMVCAMALNLTVAAGAFLLDRECGTTRGEEEEKGGASKDNIKPVPFLLIMVVFVSAGGILAAEVIANQMFMLVATISFYAPAAILVAIISSLALGAFIVPRLRARLPQLSAPSVLAIVMRITALLFAAGPVIFMGIVNQFDMLEINRSVSEFFIKLTLLALVSLGPAFLLAGLVFPLTISWLKESTDDTEGERLGWLFAVSGLGGVVGAEAAYQVLLPSFNVYTALGIVAIVYAIAAMALSIRDHRQSISWINFPTVAMTLLTLILIFALQHLPLVSKRFGNKLLDNRSGREGSVAVMIERNGGRCIVVDNQYVLGGTSTRAFEERQANLPLLLHPAPRDIAFVGLATGITPGAALLHSNIHSITVVELSPLVERAANKFFGEFNHNVTQSDRARVIVDDGRTVIASAPGRFDMVVGDLFLPWVPGEARLYSVEHFCDVRRSLRPGGIFCQWLATYQLTEPQLEIIAETFQKVFPHTYLFCNNLERQKPAIMLVGFQDDQKLNWQTVADRCSEMKTNKSLTEDPLLRDEESIAQLFLGEWKQPLLENPTAINTLGNLLIELDSGRERLTVNPGTKYLYGRRWLKFCQRKRRDMAIDGLPKNSPLTLSVLQRADALMREDSPKDSRTQPR